MKGLSNGAVCKQSQSVSDWGFEQPESERDTELGGVRFSFFWV